MNRQKEQDLYSTHGVRYAVNRVKAAVQKLHQPPVDVKPGYALPVFSVDPAEQYHPDEAAKPKSLVTCLEE